MGAGAINAIVNRTRVAIINLAQGCKYTSAVHAGIGCARVEIIAEQRLMEAGSVDAKVIGAGVSVIKLAYRHVLALPAHTGIGGAGIIIITIFGNVKTKTADTRIERAGVGIGSANSIIGTRSVDAGILGAGDVVVAIEGPADTGSIAAYLFGAQVKVRRAYHITVNTGAVNALLSRTKASVITVRIVLAGTDISIEAISIGTEIERAGIIIVRTYGSKLTIPEITEFRCAITVVIAYHRIVKALPCIAIINGAGVIVIAALRRINAGAATAGINGACVIIKAVQRSVQALS